MSRPSPILPTLLAPGYEEMRTFLFVVVHLPLLGLRTRSLYISTFKSRWIVRGVVPNSSTSSWVVTVPFSLMYIYTDLMRVSIRCVEGFKRPLPILASFAWHNRPLADERCLCLCVYYHCTRNGRENATRLPVFTKNLNFLFQNGNSSATNETF